MNVDPVLSGTPSVELHLLFFFFLGNLPGASLRYALQFKKWRLTDCCESCRYQPRERTMVGCFSCSRSGCPLVCDMFFPICRTVLALFIFLLGGNCCCPCERVAVVVVDVHRSLLRLWCNPRSSFLRVPFSPPPPSPPCFEYWFNAAFTEVGMCVTG